VIQYAKQKNSVLTYRASISANISAVTSVQAVTDISANAIYQGTTFSNTAQVNFQFLLYKIVDMKD
jgi:hypothetical protein